MLQTPAPSGGLTDTEKKEKEALVKKLSEMEEELKVITFADFLQVFYLGIDLEHFLDFGTTLEIYCPTTLGKKPK